MSIVITRLFDTYEHASQAVAELESSGIRHDDISLVANNAEGRHTLPPDANAVAPTATAGTVPPFATTAAPITDADTATAYTTPATAEAGSGAGAGASIGTVLGGGAGLLAGLGLLAIPGVGPVIAAGWLVATAVGAGVGAGAGGLLGSLVGAGVDESEAHVYAEGVRRGDTLVTVRADESQRDSVEEIMARYNAVDATARGPEYRAGGWERFDEAAPAYRAGGSPVLGLPAAGAVPPIVPVPGVDPERDPRERSTTLL